MRGCPVWAGQFAQDHLLKILALAKARAVPLAA
jgi:hypothetical protein